ncbi:acetylornithine deacetylase [Maliponia aquimaris]|uniref:Acetylornithine deacetylase n=1 Tax=Maliponia aquimaris TaxID=1673631 RepID=A0A238KA38_9RHOB|nr:acetylornithine deacetylase [Maliponia aquimaris]SMX38836.1 Acetylornithine deacetylase [Maliponia aquimaris]
MTGTAEVLERLVAFDTVSARSNLDLVGYVEAFLKERGFAVTRMPDDTGQKAGLYAQIGPEGAGVLLSAHTDVVPVEGQAWTRDPFRLTAEGDRLYGRGTTDMKGFLAAMLSAADRAARRDLREPLKLSISYDEEVGCLGMARMAPELQTLVGKPRACIVGEPTGMQVAVGHKGKRAFRAICHGQAGHSALAPRFVNALHLAGDFMTELRGIQDWLAAEGARDAAYDVPHATVHVGTLSGGTALNIVPDRAEMAFELRFLGDDVPDAIVRRIMAAAERVSAAHPGGRIEVETVNAYPGLSVAPGAEVVRVVRHLAGNAGTLKVAFGTEAGFFDRMGVPTVVCGPGSMEGQGHKADEYIETAQLALCDAMLDRVLDSLT